MNQMMEAWKQVPDLSEEVSPPRSNASSKGIFLHHLIFSQIRKLFLVWYNVSGCLLVLFFFYSR